MIKEFLFDDIELPDFKDIDLKIDIPDSKDIKIDIPDIKFDLPSIKEIELSIGIDNIDYE